MSEETPTVRRSHRAPVPMEGAAEAWSFLLPGNAGKRDRTAADGHDGGDDMAGTTSAPPKKKKKGPGSSLPGNNRKEKSSSASACTQNDAPGPAASSLVSEAPSVPNPPPSQRVTIKVVDDEDEPHVETAEEQRARLMVDWHSAIYAFWHPIPKIGYERGRRYHEFRCFKLNCQTTCRRYLDTKDAASTGNMHKHATKCWSADVVKAALDTKSATVARETLAKSRDGSIAAAFQRQGAKVTYSVRQHTSTESRAEIVRWVSESLLPFSVVEGRGFHCLMKTGRTGCHIPSSSTVGRDVRQVFKRTRERIARMLQNIDGQLHIQTDCWTSPNHRALMAFTVTFEDKGELITLTLDVVEVPKSHTGENLALAFQDVLKDFGVSYKILATTLDNATSNDKMVDRLDEMPSSFSKKNHVRCFLHINNLVAQQFIRQFDSPQLSKSELEELVKTSGTEDSQYFQFCCDADVDTTDTTAVLEDGPVAEEDDNNEGMIDEIAEMLPEERNTIKRKIQPVKLVLAKIRKLSFSTIYSTTKLLPAWKECLREQGQDIRLIPRDVRTRWNSTYDLLVFLKDHKKAYMRFTEKAENGLRGYELSETEWRIVEELCNVLQYLKEATLFFSRATPNLANVLPVMDMIDTKLKTVSIASSIPEPIRTAAELARKTLQKYYNRTDDSEAYRIAMVLHPSYKLQYFKNAGWDQADIDTAVEMLRTQYEFNYYDATKTTKPAAADPTVDQNAETPNLFDSILQAACSSTTALIEDEIARYLATDTEIVANVLMWWWERKKMFPCLYRMALDYLSIPATSVDVERVFSRGRLLITHVRSRLSVETTRAILCLGSWSLRGYIKDSDVKKVTELPELEGEDAEVLEVGWAKIAR